MAIISIKLLCRLDGEVVKRFMHYVSTGPMAREFKPRRSNKKKGNAQKSQDLLDPLGFFLIKAVIIRNYHI